MGVVMVGELLQLLMVAGAITGALSELSPRQLKEQVEVRSNGSKLSVETHHLTEWGRITSAPLATDIITFANGTKFQLFPTSEETLRHQHLNGTRRNLGDFRQCSPCTCCDRTRKWCLPTVCCYNIRCGIPGLPFGMCSFIPVSCTCYGCRD